MTWELHLAGCHSLKDKRHVLKSLKDRLHNRFNVSAAETAHHDLWQRAELTGGVVSTDRGHAQSVLREADRLIEAAGGGRIVDTSARFLWYEATGEPPPPARGGGAPPNLGRVSR